MNKNSKLDNFIKYIKQRKLYLLGVTLGLSLIIINAFVGLSMVDILLSERTVAVKKGISIPVIKVNDYEAVKEDHLHRLDKQPLSEYGEDPFGL